MLICIPENTDILENWAPFHAFVSQDSDELSSFEAVCKVTDIGGFVEETSADKCQTSSLESLCSPAVCKERE